MDVIQGKRDIRKGIFWEWKKIKQNFPFIQI